MIHDLAEENNVENTNPPTKPKPGRPRGKNPLRKPRIYEEALKDGRTRWVLDARLHNGKRSRRYYDTQKEAETAQIIKYTLLTNEGIGGSQIAPGLREEAIKCQKMLDPFQATLTDAVTFYLKSRPTTKAETLGNAIEAFTQSRIAKNLRPRSISTFQAHLNIFKDGMGDISTHEITGQKIEKWLEKQKWAAKTKNSRTGTLATFFKFAQKKGWLQNNPTASLEKARIDRGTPIVYTVEETQALLTAARKIHPEILGLLAIGIFAGLRTTELLQLRREYIVLDRKEPFIRIPEEIAKTRARRLVPISPNLAKWLKIATMPAQGPLWSYWDTAFWKRAKAVAIAAGVPLKKNARRHSFASYHLAAHQNEGATSMATGHSPKMLHERYKESVEEGHAKAYWKIQPTKALPAPAMHAADTQPIPKG